MTIRKYKQLLAGMLIGGVVASSGTVLAKTEISAVVADWIKFKFDGKEQLVPEGYTTLIYEGRTYVPARFIAEQLGAEVGWDEKTYTVSVTKPVTPIETKQPLPQIEYEKLPVSETKNGVRVEIYEVLPKENSTYFYLRVKNTSETPMQFDQSATIFESENIKYKNTAVEGVLNPKDNTWYNDIHEDQTSEGFVLVPEIPGDVRQGTIHLKVIQNDRNQKEIPFTFDLSWE